MRYGIGIAGVAGILLAACSHTPPRELVDARVTLVTAQQGDVDEVSPDAWRDAEVALRNANEAWASNKSDEEVRDLSYVAIRQTQRAEAVARAEKLRQQRAEALSFLEQNDERNRRQIQAELRQTREQLEQLEAQRKLDEQARAEAERIRAEQESLAQRSLAEQEALAERQRIEAEAEAERQRMAEAQAARDRELEEERAARMAAEREAAEARAQLEERLKELAQVREEARGTVLTLSGTLLFSPGKSVLLPAARAKLDQLAQVLTKMPDQNLRIEGHTDAQGSELVNEALSLRRAEAVRSHLIAQGVPAGRIDSRGLGESSPLADNSTAAGRAQNRRVEIVLVEPRESERGIGGAGDDKP